MSKIREVYFRLTLEAEWQQQRPHCIDSVIHHLPESEAGQGASPAHCQACEVQQWSAVALLH